MSTQTNGTAIGLDAKGEHVAEIDVVPRKRTNVWLWIVIAIVLVVLAMMLLGVFSGDATSRVGELFVPTGPTSAAGRPGV
jgi:hypothetical protein